MNCPDCGLQMWGVQYCLTPEDYDGVSEWACPGKCGARIGRWTGDRLGQGEIEARGGHRPPYVPDLTDRKK